MVKIIIAGSRALNLTPEQIGRAFDSWLRIDCNTPNPYGGITIISGAAPGVDRAGELFAASRGYGVERFPADWSRHGKAAGPVRNKQMAEIADAALVFLRGEPSPGSSNMATWMLLLDKPVRVVAR